MINTVVIDIQPSNHLQEGTDYENNVLPTNIKLAVIQVNKSIRNTSTRTPF